MRTPQIQSIISNQGNKNNLIYIMKDFKESVDDSDTQVLMDNLIAKLESIKAPEEWIIGVVKSRIK